MQGQEKTVVGQFGMVILWVARYAVQRLRGQARVTDWYWKDSSLWYALVF